MHQKNIIAAGKELNEKNKVLILLHGRGGSAEDILSFSLLRRKGFYTAGAAGYK
jgi:predicted esterase